MIKAAAGQLKHANFFLMAIGLGRGIFRFLGLAASFLLDESFELLQWTRAAVFLHTFAIFDPEQCRVTFHLELLANGTVKCAVDFRNWYRCVVFQWASQFFPGWCQMLLKIVWKLLVAFFRWRIQWWGEQYLTVTTPWSVEFHKVIAGGYVIGKGLFWELV